MQCWNVVRFLSLLLLLLLLFFPFLFFFFFCSLRAFFVTSWMDGLTGMAVADYVLSFINHPSDGFTRSMDESGYWEVRTCLSVQFVWPLLEPKFSDADRAPYHFFIANVLLHELAHAYHCKLYICIKNIDGDGASFSLADDTKSPLSKQNTGAIDMMLTDPDQLRRTPYGQTLPHDIFPLLQQLGNEMLPPYQENEFTLQGLKWNGLFRGSDLTSEQWLYVGKEEKRKKRGLPPRRC